MAIRKIVGISLNSILAIALGALWSCYLCALILWWNAPRTQIEPIEIGILLTLVALGQTAGLVLEHRRTENRVVRLFQGDWVRKTLLIMGTLAFFKLQMYGVDRFNHYYFGPYESYAGQISKSLEITQVKRREVLTIYNPLNVETLLIFQAYPLNELDLLNTGLVSRRLARAMEANGQNNDGVYLLLAKGDRVMATIALPLGLELAADRRFLIAKPSNRITFRFKRVLKDTVLVDIR